jgi:hypothetical protein
MDYVRPRNSGLSQECIGTSKTGRLFHSVYSLDLFPGKFFFFGHIKGKMFDYSCESREDILRIITEIVSQIDKTILTTVFDSQTKWLQWVIKYERQDSKMSFEYAD